MPRRRRPRVAAADASRRPSSAGSCRCSPPSALFYLLVPILVMIAFSFNDPPGRFNFVWGEFSLGGWLNPFGRPGPRRRRS